MELNKYDLILWVAKQLNEQRVRCANCMFECNKKCYLCTDKKALVEELLKKYNL